MHTDYRIILASASPRRKELLTQMGLKDFTIHPASGDETITSKDPALLVEELSAMKASEVFDVFFADPGLSSGSKERPLLVIGADTVVVESGRILGKPKDREDAVKMLMSLQGRTHSVFTGVTLVFTKNEPGVHEGNGLSAPCRVTFHSETKVTFSEMNENEIRAYAATGEPDDKAGAYAAQGLFCRHLRRIDGEYSNVVGLPTAALYACMLENGLISP